MILSKYNMDDAKNNVNLGDESKNVFDSKIKKTDDINSENNILNSNNIDETTFNEKKQKGNTQINLNENNLDKSDNKIFKEDQNFKSIKVYMKKPKEVRSNEKEKEKENEFDELEILNETIFNNLNMISDRKKADFKGEDLFSQNKESNEAKGENNNNIENEESKISKIDENNKNSISGIINKNLSPINNSSLIKEEENINNNNILNSKKYINNNKNNENSSNSMVNKDNNTSMTQKENNKEDKNNINNDINFKEKNNNQSEDTSENKLSIKKVSIKENSIFSSSKEEEIIFTKPILVLEYLNKIRKDTRMNIRPEKLPRVFISKTYTSLEKQNNSLSSDELLIIPKINFCYFIKSPNIITIDNKKNFIKTIINERCFITKFIGNNLNNMQKIDSNMEGETRLEDLANKNKKKKKKKIKKKKKR